MDPVAATFRIRNGARRLPMRAVAVFLAACIACTSAAARLGAEERLVFTADTVAINAASTRAPLHATFPFRNDGSAAVAITAVESSCDCASAAPPEEPCAPGQTGSLDVVFAPRGLGGEHAVLLSVHLASGRVIPLHLRVTLPPGTVLDQTILVWALGEAPTTRTVAVQCHGVVTGARSSDPSFTVAVRPVEAGARYLVDITPRSTATRLLATISVQVQAEGDVSLFAAVGGALAK